MLHNFLTSHKQQLIDDCNRLVMQRSAVNVAINTRTHGIPVFLDQLIATLQTEQASDHDRSLYLSGTGDGRPGTSEIGATAAFNGSESLKQGLAVDQLVHGYGDLCQTITNLVNESGASITADEFRTLNRCLDNAIAAAVSEYQYQHDQLEERKAVAALNEQLGVLAHELRNHVNTASVALVALKAGYVGVEGATAGILNRSLIGLRDLIDRSLLTVRLTPGLAPRYQQVWLSEFISDVASAAALEARSRQCGLEVTAVDASLAVNVDREMLYSAVGNLLANAMKFTRHSTDVSLRAYAAGDRVLIEVGDHCGGLPSGEAEQWFLPLKPDGSDRSGLGLGLSICRRSIEQIGGVLSARDFPGIGCVLTIDLPRYSVV